MRFVIVTGMSGAGKSSVLKMLEDAGYYCVDNMPIPLIPKFAELTKMQEDGVPRVALGADIRSGSHAGSSLKELEEVIEQIKEDGIRVEVLFLDSSEEILVKRFKETRRAHPLRVKGRVEEGIRTEREEMAALREKADYILDTSLMLIRELRREIEKIFVEDESYQNLYITVLSFGFKYGIPRDSDLVFDVRFMPNPYYDLELRQLTGNDEKVQEFVMSSPVSQQFLDKFVDMITFLIPNYVAEGKNQLVISVGCTGGKHRSVTVANRLYEALSKCSGYGVKVEHRDIEKDTHRKKLV